MTRQTGTTPGLAPNLGPFSERPWLRLTTDDLGPAGRVPTMLSAQEQRLYFWLTSTWATGEGTVVDLGAFAGGSTACLAEGVRRAGRQTRVFAFDRFRVSTPIKESVLYPAGIAPFEGEDLIPHAETHLAPWSDLVTLRPGEIEEAEWTGGPIEVLAIDAAKTVAATDRVAEIFFPHLISGRSVVVHQDFLFWKVPWLPAQMEWLGGYFRPVARCPHDAMVFLCTETPSPEALEQGRVRNRRDQELRDAIAATRARLREWGIGDRLNTQEVSIEKNPNARRAKDFLNRP